VLIELAPDRQESLAKLFSPENPQMALPVLNGGSTMGHPIASGSSSTLNCGQEIERIGLSQFCNILTKALNWKNHVKLSDIFIQDSTLKVQAPPL